MTMQNSQWRIFALLLAVPLGSCLSAAIASAVEPKSAEQADEPTPAKATTNSSRDPYEVPEGSVDDLLGYIQTGPVHMRPRSVLDLRRMNQSLDMAAQRIFASQEASDQQRLLAASLRVKFLHRLRLLGVKESGHKLDAFLSNVANDPAPRLQAFARYTQLDRQLDAWQHLCDQDRQAIIAEVRSGIEAPQADEHDLALLLKLADTVAESPDATKVAEVIEQLLPQLANSPNASITAHLPWLEGVARRLKLPGNALEVEGELLSGDQLDWQDYRGKVVLVGFWATWSRPSTGEVSNIKTAYNAYHDRGFEVIGVSLDTNQEAVRTFVADRKIPWPVIYNQSETVSSDDSSHWNHPLASKYAINTIPRAILVDQEGNVIHMNLRGKNLHQTLAQILGPTPRLANRPEGEPTPAGGKAVATDP
ncbi:peroxiredoxin family protein [Aeoliella mucimassa]|uniref:Thiol-disulfide oxidoreductase ResA n=1 Tax=Aeoliella mucimassa TaxID=2527972 RepID=A0A518AUS5_9BACT|nr:TlpA disulfide reductase family protein [Aeoliella mucimassa]QDU58468.1 Thiol-disulfide oxidoreductase ResA [Aeoliella mucimassa]